MTSRMLLLTAVTLAGCGSGGGFPDAPQDDAPPAPGTFTLEWAVTDTNNNLITCDQIGAQSVTAASASAPTLINLTDRTVDLGVVYEAAP